MRPRSELHLLLECAARTLSAATQTALGRLGLSTRDLAALTLVHAAGAIAQGRVARQLGVDRTAIVYIVNRLEQKGLIARSRDGADQRRKILHLTVAGRDLLRQAQHACEGASRTFAAGDELALTSILERVLHHSDVRSDAGE